MGRHERRGAREISFLRPYITEHQVDFLCFYLTAVKLARGLSVPFFFANPSPEACENHVRRRTSRQDRSRLDLSRTVGSEKFTRDFSSCVVVLPDIASQAK